MIDRNDEGGTMNDESLNDTGRGKVPFILHPSSFILFALLFVAVTAWGQDRYTPTSPIPLGDTLLTLPTSHIPSEGTWEVKFTHRFNQSIDQGSFSDLVHSLWGLDSNADVGLGLSYAPRRDLQLSFYRSNAMDDIELAAKYVVIQQEQAIPFSAAVRIGGAVGTKVRWSGRVCLCVRLVISAI